MVSPLVSVIMPVFNAEKYLREAVESILNQTYKYLELIIIDDGSADGSRDIIESYNDERIVFLKNSKNQGIVYTLNKGLDNSTGKYIARMDSDDISVRSRIEKQVELMESNPDIGICAGLIKAFGVEPQNVYLPPITSEEIKCSLLFDSAMPHPTVMMRADIIDRYNLRYPDYIAEDYMLWVAASEYCKFVTIPEILLHYRITSSNLTAIMNKKEDIKKQTFMQAYDIMLRRCGLISNIENRTLQYHFNSGRLTHQEIPKLKQHLKKIIKANKSSGYYNRKVLKDIVGKRWIAYIRRNKQYKNIISVFTYYGIRYIITRLIDNPIKMMNR